MRDDETSDAPRLARPGGSTEGQDQACAQVRCSGGLAPRVSRVLCWRRAPISPREDLSDTSVAVLLPAPILTPCAPEPLHLLQISGQASTLWLWPSTAT